jgi:uncharacterized protein (DUF111 family)
MTPVIMKKSRPGNVLSVLCDPDVAARVKEIIFANTSSIGLREYSVNKNILHREIVVVPTRFGEVNVKRSYFGGRVVSEKPEFEQCRRLAVKHSVTLEEIQKEVIKNL